MKDFYPTIDGKRTHIRATSQRDLEQKILARRRMNSLEIDSSSKI